MSDKYLELAKKIILDLTTDENIEIFLFRPRASKNFRRNSDIDIGLLSKEKVNRKIISRIYDELQNPRMPYHIDIVDFLDVDEEFKNAALKNRVVWKKGKNIN